MAKEELSDKIYLITFDKPKYIMEIGEILYNEQRATYPKLMGEKGAIKKCLEKGLIKKTSVDIPKEKPLGFEKREYYISNIVPIIKEIEKQVDLTDEEKKDLLNLFDTDVFRTAIGDTSRFIDFKNRSINAFEIINDLIGYLCVYIFMIKNYGTYFNKKTSKLFPPKKPAPNLYKMGLDDLELLQKEVHKKGFDEDKFMEYNRYLYEKLIPKSNDYKIAKGELLKHYFELSKRFYVLPFNLIEKLSGIIPIHKSLFLNFLAGGFITSDNVNQLLIDALVKEIGKIKSKKGGFRQK